MHPSIVPLDHSTTYQPPPPFHTGGLRDCLRACYQASEFDHDLRHPQRAECIVGEPIDLVANVTGIGAALSLVRAPDAPEGHAARFSAPRLIAGAPGLHVVRITIAGFARDVEVVAYPRSILECVDYPATMPRARRQRLRALTQAVQVTHETIAIALESGKRIDPSIFSWLHGLGGDAPVNMRAFQ